MEARDFWCYFWGARNLNLVVFTLSSYLLDATNPNQSVLGYGRGLSWDVA